MIKLEFEELMSGVRVNLNDELYNEMQDHIDMFGYITPHNVPEFVFYGIWWEMKGVSLEVLFIRDSEEEIKIRQRFGEKEIMKSDYYSKSFYDSLTGRLSQDDQIKVWLHKEKPELWQQLVDYCGSEKKVFDRYIRFNH